MEKGTKIALILIIIIMFGIVGAGGWYLGTKYANHEQKTNNKQPEKKDEEPKESNEPKLSLLSLYFYKYNGLAGLYSDGTFKKFSENVKLDNYSLDGETLYYADVKGNVKSFNINNPSEETKLFKLSDRDISFSVKDDKMYYVTISNAKNYAVTRDLKTSEETKKEIKVERLNVNSYDGNILIFDDEYNAFVESSFYTYNFETEELKEIGHYDYLIEYRNDYALFETIDSQEERNYCLYDLKNSKEKFCINNKNLKEPEQAYESLATTNGKSIFLISDNKVLECTEKDTCDKVVYTLTDEEKEAPYLAVMAIGNNIILTVGTNEVCEEGCAYDIASYNITKDHEKLELGLDIVGYNTYHFVR